MHESHIARELLTQCRGAWGKPEVFGQGKTLPPSSANAHLYRPMIFRDRAGAFFVLPETRSLKVKVSRTEEQSIHANSATMFYVFLQNMPLRSNMFAQIGNENQKF